MNSAIVDSVSQPRRLTEIRRRWMHDNNELHQARAIIEELKDEKYRLESQLQTTRLRESRFLSEKNKAEDDLKRVIAHLAEARLLWARDIAEKDRVLAHAKSVQEELERKAITEAQKVRSEMSAQVENFRIDTDFVSQVQERYQALTVEVEASNAKAQAKQRELEEREGQLRELQHHCDFLVSERNTLAQSSVMRLKEVESALEQANAEVDSLTSQLAALRGDRNWLITSGLSEKSASDFHTARGKFQGDMADALEAAYTEPLPGYADLMDKVNEDSIDSLRLMLDPAEESEEE
ncbi:hypothetical protein Hanom_Chr14g01292011 [Helianthus anomalus]